jgi:type II secretory pathway component PulF
MNRRVGSRSPSRFAIPHCERYTAARGLVRNGPEWAVAATASLSLDELVAINDELAALVRAGVPLESTLGEIARDLPGRLGKTTTLLANRMERGETLSEALAAMPDAFPPMYRTAIEAGVRAGRLPVVLEDLAQSARRMSEMRRVISLAALYPLLILFIAIGFFSFFTKKIAPILVTSFEGHAPYVARAAAYLGQSADIWAPIALVGLFVGSIIWFIRMQRGKGSMAWIPVIGRLERDARIASFSEILGLLVEHDVPLPQAVLLAADATADKRLSDAARQLAEQLERGAVSVEGALSNGQLPPFFVWLTSISSRKELLVPLLEQSAEMYRRRALQRADWLRVYIPIFMTLAIGGVIVFIYALSLFMPLTDLLYDASMDNLMLD